MDWSSIISVILAALVLFALPLALRKRKKTGPQKKEELYQHLQKVGVKAYTVETGSDQEKIGRKRSWGEKSEGVIELKNRNIDSINVISVAGQYGVHYFIDYLVRSPSIVGKRVSKKTRLIRERKPPLWGKVSTIEWRGDQSLAQSLNFDYSLKDRLQQSGLTNLKGGIWIFPEPKYGYTRIRTAYSLPSPETFEAIESIAKHIKSW